MIKTDYPGEREALFPKEYPVFADRKNCSSVSRKKSFKDIMLFIDREKNGIGFRSGINGNGRSKPCNIDIATVKA